MQSTYSLTLDQLTPYRGQLLCELLTGSYETESGILVVQGLKKNPYVEKMKVIKHGGPFTAYEFYVESKKIKKEWPGIYWAEPGDIIWCYRQPKKQDIEGKTYGFMYNENIRAAFDGTRLKAPADYTIVEPIYKENADGSFLLVQDRDRKTTAEYTGVLVDIGPQSKNRFENLKPGERIIFKRNYGTSVEGTAFKHEGKEYLSLNDKWTLAKDNREL